MTLLHHELLGAGPPLVLLSGFASDLQTWVFQRDAFAERHQVVLIDNRGVGRSHGTPISGTTRGMAEEVVRVLDAAGIKRAHVLGHSLGGAVAQELCLLEPERVQRLILVSTFATGGIFPIEPLRAWQRSLEGGVDEERLTQEVLPWIYSAEFLRAPNRIKSIIGFLRSHKNPPRPAGLKAQVEAIIAHDTLERLCQITAPTLVLVGSLDRLTPPKMNRVLADQIPGAKFLELPGAAHACMLERAEVFSKAVLDFC